MTNGEQHATIPRPWRLVLSGGGTGGAYWMAGALAALAGTGADAVMGSVIALGGRPWDLAARSGSPAAPGLADASVRRAARQRPRDVLRHRLIPSMGVRLSAAIGSLLPMGSHSTEHIEAMVRDFVAPGGG